MNPTTIHVHKPVHEGQLVRFGWTIEPAATLYSGDGFSIEFPESVDVSQIDEAVWLRVMMICTHTHWSLLRPCRVVLPYRLPEGEIEFWRRMTDAATWALESRREDDQGLSFAQRTRRTVEIVCQGEPLAPLDPVEDAGLVVSCFSGGRDSLTQLALLQELGEQPLLVTTTSARLGSDEMVTARRRSVIDQIQSRRDVELVEVGSDLRATIVNDDETIKPFRTGTNEITDTFLYFACAWVTALARGARAVYLASETEVQESRRIDGAVAQHRHFMYSAATQRALRSLIAPTGIEHCGLTYALHQFQVQRLLNARFEDIRDLQYSCWSQRPGEASCSRCGECFVNAVDRMHDGIPPSEIGIDVNELFVSQQDWQPESHAGVPSAAPGRSARRFSEGRAIALFSKNSNDALARFAPDGKLSPQAAAACDKIRAAAAPFAGVVTEPGYRSAYFEFIDPKIASRLEEIVREHFEPEPTESYADVLENTRLLSQWVTAPLRAPSAETEPIDTTPSSNSATAAEPSTEQLARIAPLIPEREPVLSRDSLHRVLPVADTDLNGSELDLVTEAVRTNWVSSTGPQVEEFEQIFAEYCGTRHAVTTASGASALEVMIRAAGIGEGDEVIVPSFTMVATANAVHHSGAKVVFVDTDPATWNMDLTQTRLAIGPRTKAIIAVHTYGHPVDMDALRELCDRNSLILLEDAAEAHGATVRGRRVGSLGDAAAFSFYGNKIVTTGEGGMITTDDDNLAAAARELRSHAFSADRHFWHRRRAFNVRMSNLQAAVGVAQMERIGDFLRQRAAVAQNYRKHLAGIPGIEFQPGAEDFESVNWMFGIVLGDDFPLERDALRELLAAEGIETRTFFVPLHIQPAYIEEFDRRSFPVAERLGARGLYLPSAMWLDEDDVMHVARWVAQAAGVKSRETSRPYAE